MRDGGLSDFDVMYERLDAWGFQGRADSDKPDPEAGTGAIYDMGRADKGDGEQMDAEGESFWNDEEPRRLLSEREWDTLDGYVRQLSQLHRKHVRDSFYRRFGVYHRNDPVGERYREYQSAAVRAVCDLEQANAAVRDKLRGRV